MARGGQGVSHERNRLVFFPDTTSPPKALFHTTLRVAHFVHFLIGIPIALVNGGHFATGLDAASVLPYAFNSVFLFS
jgi:hypothetical protein